MTRPVVLVIVAIFATLAAQIMVLILVPLAAVDLGLSPTTAVALIAVWGLLGIFIDIPISALSDARGRRPPVVAGGLAMAAGVVALAMASDLALLLVGMALFGLGQSLTFGPLLAFLTEIAEPARHANIQGVNGAIQGVATVIGALLAAVFAGAGLAIAFIPVFVLALVTSAAVIAVPERLGHSVRGFDRRQLFGSYRLAFKMGVSRPGVTLSSLMSVLFSIVFLVAVASILPLVLVEIEGYAIVLAAALVAFRNLAASVMSLAFARVSGRFGVTRSLVNLSWLAVIGTALLAVTTASPVLILIPLVMQAAGLAFGPAAANVLVTQATSVDERAVGMAAGTVAGRLAVLVVPIMLAPLVVPSMAGSAFLAAAAMAAGVVLLMHVVARRVVEPGPMSNREREAAI